MNTYANHTESISRSRQELIEGWDQEAIRRGHVVIIGSNSVPGELLCVLIAALGSRISLIQDEQADGHGALVFAAADNVFAVREFVKELFPDAQIDAYGIFLRGIRTILRDVNLVVDCSGNLDTIHESLVLAKNLDIPIAVVSSGQMGVDLFWNLQDPENLPEDIAVNGGLSAAFAAAAMAGHEFRRLVCRLKADTKPAPVIRYRPPQCEIHFPHKAAIVQVGAGGIGGSLALSLAAELASDLTLIDADVCEPSNRARNPFIEVDSLKVEGLKKWVDRVSPNTICTTCAEYIGSSDFLNSQHCDLLVAAVDNYEARLLCNDAAMDSGIPFVQSGCSPYGATAYIMGGANGRNSPHPACYRCRVPDVKTLVQVERESCSGQPAASLITTNWIAASFASSLSKQALALGSDAFAGVLEFNPSDPNRFRIRQPLRCECR